MKKYNEVEQTDNMKIKEEVSEERVEKKTLEKVVSVQPKKVKRGLVGRLVSGVLGPEGAAGIGEYITEEIIKPAVKNLIVDSVTSGINKLMYGDKVGGGYRPYNSGGYQRQSYGGGYQRTNYSSRYTQHNPEPAQPRTAGRPRHGVEEYLIEERNDAAHVLVTLTENADMYGHVSVADYYDLIGVASVYTDNQYGWTIDSINRASIVPVRGGYIIKFPPVEVI